MYVGMYDSQTPACRSNLTIPKSDESDSSNSSVGECGVSISNGHGFSGRFHVHVVQCSKAGGMYKMRYSR